MKKGKIKPSFRDSIKFSPTLKGSARRGKYLLQNWVIHILKKQIPVIDARILSQLIAGDRSRYTHDEFINDLYDRISWAMVRIRRVEVLAQSVPLEQIKAFLEVCSEVRNSRIFAFKKNEECIQRMKRNNELYDKTDLGEVAGDTI